MRARRGNNDRAHPCRRGARAKSEGKKPSFAVCDDSKTNKSEKICVVRGVETNNQPFSIQAVPRVRVTLRDKKQTDAISQIGEL